MAAAASPWAWPPTSRPIIWARSSTRWLRLIAKPELSIEELMEIIPGPDFPTGAAILGRSGIRQAYLTGTRLGADAGEGGG